MSKILSITPELPSLDLNRTRTFYKTKLGFKTVSQYHDYAIFARDGVWINYVLCDDAEAPKNASCYIYIDDANSLYAELQPHGVIHPHGALADKPYGVREFSVLDDNGCLLKFGQRLNEDVRR
ncbi:MAG: VOC family protein [Chloroflexota bacterium]|nr:VOC family protein [Chloroflexota bacterium]